jgi:hypothetical protein
LLSMSKPTSVTGSESEFEFVETPKAGPPTFEKDEDCGVKTTKVCFAENERNQLHCCSIFESFTMCLGGPHTDMRTLPALSLPLSKMPPSRPTALVPTPSTTRS